MTSGDETYFKHRPHVKQLTRNNRNKSVTTAVCLKSCPADIMWRNWIPFFKKNDQEKTVTTSETQRKGKENGDSRKHGAIGDSLERHGPILDGRQLGQRGRGPGSQPRSPFTKRSRFVESENSGNDSVHLASKFVTVPTGRPLLTTPLLPKIKRVMELNDSLRQDYSVRSSPTRQRVVRSHSLNHGPTHPITSSPGRLPVVRLQRRPSLHLISGRSVRSPSTVKVAPPEPSRLMGPSMFMSSSTKTSPIRPPMVDTQTVVSALRERSNRKRSTVASADDSITDEEFTQMSKRRRQDSVVSSTSSAVSMLTLPDKLPDLSRPLDRFSPLVQLRGSPVKRPVSAPRRASLDESGAELPPMAKREKRQSNGRILSSLSSFTRSPPSDQGNLSESQTQAVTSKRTRSADTVDTAITTCDQDRQPSKKLNRPPSSHVHEPAREPVQPAARVTKDSNSDNVKEKSLSATTSFTKECVTSTTPKKKLLLHSTEQTSKHKTDIYPALRRCAPKVQPVAVASPADLESDRRAEEALRVQSMLDYLDQDDEDSLTKSLTAPAFTSSTSAPTSSTPATTITNLTANSLTTTITITNPANSSNLTTNTTSTPQAVTTTASSLSQLLAAPLSLPSQPPSSSSSLSLSSGVVPKSTAPSSLAKSGLGANISGLVQSSGVNASTGLVNSMPIFSTGGFGLSSSGGVTTSGPTMRAAAALSSVSSSPASFNSGSRVSSLSGLTSLPSSQNSGTSTAGNVTTLSGLSSTTLSGLSSVTSTSSLSSAASPSQYMFKPLFGAPPASPPSSTHQDSKRQSSGGFSLGGDSSTHAGGFQFPTVSTQAPQSTFSFGVSAATMSTQSGSSGGGAAPSTTTAQAGALPFGLGSGAANVSSTGGFQFGVGANASSVATNQPATAAGFNFGAGNTVAGNPVTGNPAGNATATSTSGFNFGGGTPGSGSGPASTALGFKFGAGTTVTTTASSNPAFSFGQTGAAITSAAQPSMGVAFPASTTASFSFGTQKNVTSSTGFGMTTATSTAPFNFGGAASSASAALSFSAQGSGLGAQSSVASPFGQTTQLTTGFGGETGKGLQPKNLFGAAKPNTTMPQSLTSSGGFSGFGASAPQSGFGQTTTTTTTTASATAAGFSFGGGSAFGQGSTAAGFGATSAASGGMLSGVNATTTANSSGTLAFGQTASTTASAFPFGQSQSAGSAGFNLSQTSSTVPGFHFGAATSTTTTAAAAQSGFDNAPAATTTASGFAFGGQGSTAVPAASNLFSFGAASAAKPAVFGQSNPSQGALAFGQTASSQSTGAAFGGSGFAFGSSVTQQTTAPAFGSNPGQQSAAPAFGSAASQKTTAPAFGSNPSQKTTAPGFGAPQSAGTFGSFAGSAPSTGFNFGASSNSTFGSTPAQPAPAFGLSAAQPAPGFGSTTALPAPGFGSTTAQPPSLGAPQPSANPPAFGAPANASSVGPGNAFVFGAPNTGQAAGFAFGGASSTGAGGAGGFNFNASTGPPQFNFGASGPGQNMFNAGVSATASAARPRATAARNQRRRGLRK